ncbi:NAD(P)-binding protein [Flagelloscypha sp. PMI_526]|nr:NAD(P)-binding protein [Flagelloscypha sp. PMI_526]
MSAVFDASRLIGKTVIVTGASSGIGAATSILFAKVSFRLFEAPRMTQTSIRLGATSSTLLDESMPWKRLNSLAVEAHKVGGTGKGGNFHSVVLDVSDTKSVASFWDKVPAELRDVDILVNNAGFVLGVEHAGSIAQEDIEAMFATNVFGLIAMSQLLLKDFKVKNTGHIINLGSIAGKEPYAGGSIYTATKHAVNAFTQSMMRELVNTKIRVTEIQPGMVETEFSVVRFRGDKSKADKVYDGIQPLIGEDIAEEIVWAASRPPHVNIAETLIFPVNQASATVNYREQK